MVVRPEAGGFRHLRDVLAGPNESLLGGHMVGIGLNMYIFSILLG